jgi:hypothetical protein
MTVALDRLAASFANGVFQRGDSLLLRRGGAGHVENFFLQDCSVEIVHTVAQRELRRGNPRLTQYAVSGRCCRGKYGSPRGCAVAQTRGALDVG